MPLDNTDELNWGRKFKIITIVETHKTKRKSDADMPLAGQSKDHCTCAYIHTSMYAHIYTNMYVKTYIIYVNIYMYV